MSGVTGRGDVKEVEICCIPAEERVHGVWSEYPLIHTNTLPAHYTLPLPYQSNTLLHQTKTFLHPTSTLLLHTNTSLCRPSRRWLNHNSAPTLRLNLKWPPTPGSKPWSPSQSGTGSQPRRECLSFSGGRSSNLRSNWLQKGSQKKRKMREMRNSIFS